MPIVRTNGSNDQKAPEASSTLSRFQNSPFLSRQKRSKLLSSTLSFSPIHTTMPKISETKHSPSHMHKCVLKRFQLPELDVIVFKGLRFLFSILKLARFQTDAAFTKRSTFKTVFEKYQCVLSVFVWMRKRIKKYA